MLVDAELEAEDLRMDFPKRNRKLMLKQGGRLKEQTLPTTRANLNGYLYEDM